jgi:methylated-DNA-[protein]-cysteine S-methyltransferase
MKRADNFETRCYDALRAVPAGRVTTYSAIARALGSKASRAVGNAMRKNRDPSIPCHRVVKSNGQVGGYNRGKDMKIRMLKKEGIRIKEGRVDLSAYSVN